MALILFNGHGAEGNLGHKLKGWQARIGTNMCTVCHNLEGNEVFEVSEMMFGTRDRFSYRACSSCGCLELLNPPSNLSRYYPSNYYSMASGRLGLWLRWWLSPYMTRFWQGHRNLIGYLLCKGRQQPSVLYWLRQQGIHEGAELLDVGSGVGHLLFFLRGLGLKQLVGVDPFVAVDSRFPGGITVLKREISEVAGSFDYVVLNHSFEHMDAPLDVLKNVRRLLTHDGVAMISTPIASSFARREYGVDWVSLDAPRHLFVHTEKSVEILASQAGLRVTEVVYDSSELQFWGSEQYRAGISLHDDRSYTRSPRRSIFTPDQIVSFRQRALQLNAARDGDSASFYLEVNG